MYFALLCCPMRMTNVLHLPSCPIVFQSESHNVFKFIPPEICGGFPFPLCSSIRSFHQLPSLEHLHNWKNYPPAESLISLCLPYAVIGYLGWWCCQHTLYYLSTHVVVSFRSLSSMLVGFFYMY